MSRSTPVLLACGVLLIAGLAVGCGGPPPLAGPLPTAIPTLAPVPQPTAILPPTAAPLLPTPAAPGQVAPAAPPRQPAQQTALTTFTTANFSGSGVCASCHAPLTDEAGTDVSMPEHWRSTLMANAAKDPVWQAKLESEVARMPALQAVIEKKCLTCHTPMAETQAVAGGGPVAGLGDGFLNPNHPLHEAAMDGVSCTQCHQIRPDNFGTAESFSGGYLVDTSAVAPDRPIYGPYPQPVAALMQASTGFLPVHGPHMEQAEHCATCHNLFTPYVDAEGNVLGEFPEQTPYTEWQHSDFGASGTPCQGCHMPRAQGAVVISVVPAGLAPRQPFYQHFFAGGNALMLDILYNWGAELGVTADRRHFEATRARVADQIGLRSATLSVQELAVQGDTLLLQLQVKALTGHKFPASFPSRRAWLHVTMTDAAGAVVFESGAPNADGSITGNDADADPAAFEPHYDVITDAGQVQIYEPIMGDNEGKVTYTLLRAGSYLKDNRLLPIGADKATLPAEIAVYGQARDDPNFVGGGDTVTYRVNIADATGPFTASAELLYQPLSFQFVQDLRNDGTPRAGRFVAYYAASDKTPLRAASVGPIRSD